MRENIVNVTDRVICTKNFTNEELKQFRDVIILDYLAEFNIGGNYFFVLKINPQI